MQTATAGCSRKSPLDYPDGWTRTARHSPPQPSSRSHSDVPRPRTASTKSGRATAMRIGRTGTLNTSSASRLAKSCRYEQRLRLPCQSARFRGLKRSCNGRCSTATRQFRECPVFARNRRAVASVTRCELTFRRKLILRTSTTALRWKKGEGLPIQPGQSDDGAETATTREVERDNLVLSGAVEMTVGAKAQSTRPSKLGNV